MGPKQALAKSDQAASPEGSQIQDELTLERLVGPLDLTPKPTVVQDMDVHAKTSQNQDTDQYLYFGANTYGRHSSDTQK